MRTTDGTRRRQATAAWALAVAFVLALGPLAMPASVASAAMAPVTTPEPPAATPSETAAEGFAVTDLNQDGRVDREEYQRRMVEVFFVYDRDKDGVLIATEIVDLDPRAFAAADRNGDGKVTLQEYLNARFKDFDAADANHDGVLILDEAEVWSARQGARP